MFGGFTFSSQPVITQKKEEKPAAEVKKPEKKEEPKVGFLFSISQNVIIDNYK